MNLIFFLIILIAIGCMIMISFIHFCENKEGMMIELQMFPGKKYTRAMLICVLGLLVGLSGGAIKVVPTGYTGVKTTFGQIDNTTVQSGFNLKIPFVQSIKLVNNKQTNITIDDKIWSETKARTAIYYEGVTVTYQINNEKSSWIVANINDYEDNLITSQLVASAVKSSSKEYSDTEATDRGVIEPKIQENLQSLMDKKYGKDTVYITMVTVSNADFDESYNTAIAEKQNAQIAAETQEIENNKNIAKAEAEAKAKVIEAEGEAEANQKLEESLSDKVLKDKYIDKWNGELPNAVTDGSSIITDIAGD